MTDTDVGGRARARAGADNTAHTADTDRHARAGLRADETAETDRLARPEVHLATTADTQADGRLQANETTDTNPHTRARAWAGDTADTADTAHTDIDRRARDRARADDTADTADSDVDRRARARVRADEAAETDRRRSVSLRQAAIAFWRHPSPWLIGSLLLAAGTARLVVGDWRLSDALTPLVMLAVFPFFEWVVHVCVLHWRPRRLGPVTIDPLLAREHRAHHADPRNVPLVFIPWRVLLWLLPLVTAASLVAFPRLGLGLTYLVGAAALGLGYEWTHYLIHSDYRPKSRPYRAIWRNHRLHHYKNEHYWFTVTTSGTADRVLRTAPDPATVETSPTVRALHGREAP